MNNKGIVLFIVLGTILVVIILANVVLQLISSQSQLTQHQVSRIQAYYAAQGGLNYAREMVRLNTANWIPSPDDATHSVLARICRVASDCAAFSGPKVTDATLPVNVKWIEITVGGLGSGLSNTRKMQAAVDYTPPS